VPEWRSFEFGVTEMTDGPARMRADATGLSVHFDDDGVTVGHERGQRQVTPWSDVRRVWIGPPAVGPSGRPVTPMEIETTTGSLHLVADVDGPNSVALEALDRCLRWWSPVVGPAPGPGGVRRNRPARRRRYGVLVAGLVLIGLGLGLALDLSRSHPSRTLPRPSLSAASEADQRLADRIMLNRGDLPVGWKADPNRGSTDAPQAGQAGITRAFAGCMGVGDQQAAVILGGAASDQTAQSSSPIFVAPSVPNDQGYTVQLQTAASIVRSHRDERGDLRLLDNRRFPSCAASATASELQLGVDDASGDHEHPGPTVGTLFAVPAVAGEQVTALRVVCQVSDHGASVPVEVDAVFLGIDRIEADLEAFAVGGPVPDAVVRTSLQAFEERVAARGSGVQI